VPRPLLASARHAQRPGTAAARRKARCRRAHRLAAARLASPSADAAGLQPACRKGPDDASDWPAGAASRRSAAKRFTPRIPDGDTASDGVEKLL
jgi:hypothetical protein